MARETYKENVGDIIQLQHALSEQHGLPLILVYQEGGFVFALKKDELEGDLPKGFVNQTAQKGRWIFSSMELVSSFLVVTSVCVDSVWNSEKNERADERRLR